MVLSETEGDGGGPPSSALWVGVMRFLGGVEERKGRCGTFGEGYTFPLIAKAQ